MNPPAWWRQLRESGTIDRTPYLLIGLTLCAIKYPIDATVAHSVFNRAWTPWDYLINGSTLSTLLKIPQYLTFFLTLFAISIPFAAVGVALTFARLRSAGAHPFLVVLFFMPVLNLILILILVVLKPQKPIPAVATNPSHSTQPPALNLGVFSYGTDQPIEKISLIRHLFPKSPGASLIVSSSVSAMTALVLTWLSVDVFQSYGWGVFVASPFLCGLIASVLHGLPMPRTRKQCLAAATLAPVLVAGGVVVAGVDGAACVVMSLPILIPMSLIGGAIGYYLQRGPLKFGGTGRLVLVLLTFMPFFLGAEYVAHPAAPVFMVVTSVDIDAPPDRVWKNVLAFSRIASPLDWVFRAGVAYPIQARIDGQGVGAIRHCIFSTGEFIEPITAWDAPRLLKFDVTSNPPPMQELSPYDIHPAHVHDYLISHGGQFRLIPLAGDRTRLEGTTWYEHNMWPAGYWRLWSDFLIHRIHRRVLEHVKQLSEADSSS